MGWEMPRRWAGTGMHDGMRRDVKRHNPATVKDESATNLNLNPKFQIPNTFQAHGNDSSSGLS
jgi:hypothetical protein